MVPSYRKGLACQPPCLTQLAIASYNPPMEEAFSRTAMLVGEQGVAALADKRVAVFGVGGVGAAAAEALARSGVGALDFIDGDKVSPSNLNRQVLALTSSLGQHKAELMAQRARLINPKALASAHTLYYTRETARQFDLSQYHYVLDCVDMVTAKLLLARGCRDSRTPLICALGAGNRLDPTQVLVGDISRTHTCPLARVMRKQLKQLGIHSLTVVWSREEPLRPLNQSKEEGRHPPGSMAFVPNAMGLAMASHAVRSLLAMQSTLL